MFFSAAESLSLAVICTLWRQISSFDLRCTEVDFEFAWTNFSSPLLKNCLSCVTQCHFVTWIFSWPALVHPLFFSWIRLYFVALFIHSSFHVQCRVTCWMTLAALKSSLPICSPSHLKMEFLLSEVSSSTPCSSLKWCSLFEPESLCTSQTVTTWAQSHLTLLPASLVTCAAQSWL